MKNFSLQRAHLFVPVLGVAYILSQFLRSSNAVIAPELRSEMALLPADIGMLTGAFFLVFALVQVPVGVFLDRTGPRKVMSFMVLFAGLGCLVYANADGFWSLSVGRGLMGFGCASILMGSYVVFARWFPKDKFSSYSATLVAIGNFGIILATLPLAAAVEGAGWRTAFNWTAVASLLVVVFLFIVVRDDPKKDLTEKDLAKKANPKHASETLAQSFMQLGIILKNKTFWTLVPLMLVGYSSVATIVTLWSGPYLEAVLGMDTIARGEVLLLMAVGAVLGPMLLGHLDRVFDTRKYVVAVGVSIGIVLFMVLAFASTLGATGTSVLFFLLAMSPGYLSVFMAHARAIYPDHLVGRGMTLANVANMGGVALLQILTGYVLQLVLSKTGDIATAYKAVFALLGVSLFVALMVYLRSDDITPSQQKITDAENKPVQA
ncbi:MAG: MFS transporter [Sphingomonadales bacterium]|nr:MFS transporter [Sphingomonadales bacterium]